MQTLGFAGRVLTGAFRTHLNNALRPGGAYSWLRVVCCPDAPETFLELYMQYSQGHVLAVSNQHCDSSIYGVEGNLLFRIHHDLMHVKHLHDFTFRGEAGAYASAWAELEPYLKCWRSCIDFIHDVYFADTVGQALHFQRTGGFVEDQKAFVSTYLVQQLGYDTKVRNGEVHYYKES